MRIAVVTGASSGLGREFVKQIEKIYKDLDEIWVIARRKEKLEELKKTSSITLRIFVGNLLENQIFESFESALTEIKPNVRMLVNAAGFGKIGSVESILKNNKNSQLQMIDLNCRALSRMIFICMPYFQKNSRIINIASAAAFCPQPQFSVYAATKSYVLSFSRSLASELKPKHIYVTAVCPGPVDTEFFETSGGIQNTLKTKTMVKACVVVRQALHDSMAGKSVSIYGIAMKLSYIGSKLLPHRIIMKVLYEDTFQKYISKRSSK